MKFRIVPDEIPEPPERILDVQLIRNHRSLPTLLLDGKACLSLDISAGEGVCLYRFQHPVAGLRGTIPVIDMKRNRMK